MSHSALPASPDLQTRLQRSQGRSGRVFSINCKVTTEELRTLEQAAAANNKATSEWAREVLIAAARYSGPDVVLVELVATRMLVVNMLKMLGQNHPITEAEYAKVQNQVQGAKRRVAVELAEQTHRLNTGKES